PLEQIVRPSYNQSPRAPVAVEPHSHQQGHCSLPWAQTQRGNRHVARVALKLSTKRSWLFRKVRSGFAACWKRRAIGYGKSMSRRFSPIAAQTFATSWDINRRKCLAKHPSI